MLRACAFSVALLVTVPAWAQSEVPKRDDKPGPFGVATVDDLRLQDKKRAKELQVRVTFPKASTPKPGSTGPAPAPHAVIVWSHGMLGDKDAYQPLTGFWASHGFVVLQTSHRDSRAHGDLGAAQAGKAWDDRPRDVSFLIDSLSEIEAKVPALKGRIDKTRIGVGGHSFGAHTAALIGGVKVSTLRKSLSFRDKRVKCVFVCSGQGPGGLFTEQSFKGLAVPAFFLTGTNDKSPRNGQSPQWREEAYKLSPPGDKFLLSIDGAYHGFGGITGKARWSGSGPDNADEVRIVKIATLAFFEAFVRDIESAKTYLTSDAPSKAGEKTKIRYERK